MKKNSIRRTRLWFCMCAGSLLVTGMNLYAAEFFTIIGPDGRPLVIQKQTSQRSTGHSAAPSSKAPSNPVQKSYPTAPTDVSRLTPAVSSTQTQTSTGFISSKKATSQQAIPLAESTSKPVIKATHTAAVPSQSPPSDQMATKSADQSMPNVSQPTVKRSDQMAVTATKHTAPLPAVKTDTSSSKQSSYISSIGGEEYVNSEYLENREFNLDGKKRFYMMPQGEIDSKTGVVRMQPVEREKGVSRSFLNQVLKPRASETPTETLALSSTYFIMPKQDVTESLDTTCFEGKKMKKAKVFDTQKEVSVWPRKPLENTFDYDVVRLSEPLKQMKLTSYASTQTNPQFYWPFVVFLDQKGCVLEGVSGYKNQEYPATALKYAALEGIIRLPENAHYILMTPLASALDVEDKLLTNQGQIKLTAIR